MAGGGWKSRAFAIPAGRELCAGEKALSVLSRGWYIGGMSFTGKIQNGVVVLPPEVSLPEGTEVRVETVESAEHDPFVQAALKLAKPRPHWPKDYALNHGHYVSREPQKP